MSAVSEWLKVATPRKAKRPHLVRVLGRTASGEQRQVIIDNSKYPGPKLRTMRQVSMREVSMHQVSRETPNKQTRPA
jgi:hypothetical protein